MKFLLACLLPLLLCLVLPDAAFADGSNRDFSRWVKNALRKGDVSDPRAIEQGARACSGDKHNYSVALFCMRQVTRLNPMDSRYPFLMGCYMLHLGQGDTALQFINEAVKAAPDDPEPLNLKAEYLRELGAVNAYIDTLKKSLALKPGQRKVHERLCEALLDRRKAGDEAEAFNHALAAVAGSPARAEKFAGLFHDRERKNRLIDLAAEIRTDKAVEEYRGSIPVRNRSDIFITPGQTGKVIASYSQYKKKNTGDNTFDSKYRAMGKDKEIGIKIKAGNLPRYVRLRKLRAARKAARGPGGYVR